MQDPNRLYAHDFTSPRSSPMGCRKVISKWRGAVKMPTFRALYSITNYLNWGEKRATFAGFPAVEAIDITNTAQLAKRRLSRVLRLLIISVFSVFK